MHISIDVTRKSQSHREPVPLLRFSFHCLPRFYVEIDPMHCHKTPHQALDTDTSTNTITNTCTCPFTHGCTYRSLVLAHPADDVKQPLQHFERVVRTFVFVVSIYLDFYFAFRFTIIRPAPNTQLNTTTIVLLDLQKF